MHDHVGVVGLLVVVGGADLFFFNGWIDCLIADLLTSVVLSSPRFQSVCDLASGITYVVLRVIAHQFVNRVQSRQWKHCVIL